MNQLLLGAVAMASLVASAFFLRFWKKTGDRFFLLFGIAFIVDAIDRFVIGLLTVSAEHEPLTYLSRLVTFVIILLAILDKNRVRNRNR